MFNIYVVLVVVIRNVYVKFWMLKWKGFEVIYVILFKNKLDKFFYCNILLIVFWLVGLDFIISGVMVSLIFLIILFIFSFLIILFGFFILFVIVVFVGFCCLGWLGVLVFILGVLIFVWMEFGEGLEFIEDIIFVIGCKMNYIIINLLFM